MSDTISNTNGLANEADIRFCIGPEDGADEGTDME